MKILHLLGISPSTPSTSLLSFKFVCLFIVDEFQWLYIFLHFQKENTNKIVKQFIQLKMSILQIFLYIHI